MIAARTLEHLDGMIARTSVQRASEGTPLPRSFREIAVALREHRGVLEAGGVFLPHLIDRVIEGLELFPST